jgi:hypothetical protein
LQFVAGSEVEGKATYFLSRFTMPELFIVLIVAVVEMQATAPAIILVYVPHSRIQSVFVDAGNVRIIVKNSR